MSSRVPVLVWCSVVLAAAALLAVLVPLPSTPPPAAAGLRVVGSVVPDLEGRWTGTWQDTRYFVSGTIALDIQRDGNDYTATGEIDISSINPILGTVSGTASGTLSGNQLDFTFSASSLGSGAGSFTDADAAGTGNVGAPLNFGDFTFAGSVASDAIDGTFDFLSPTGGEGNAALSKSVAVEPASFGDVKARY